MGFGDFIWSSRKILGHYLRLDTTGSFQMLSNSSFTNRPPTFLYNRPFLEVKRKYCVKSRGHGSKVLGIHFDRGKKGISRVSRKPEIVTYMKC